MRYLGKLDRVLSIRVILLPLDKYNLFQLANGCLIFSITPTHICLAWPYRMPPTEGQDSSRAGMQPLHHSNHFEIIFNWQILNTLITFSYIVGYLNQFQDPHFFL